MSLACGKEILEGRGERVEVWVIGIESGSGSESANARGRGQGQGHTILRIGLQVEMKDRALHRADLAYGRGGHILNWSAERVL